MVSRMKSCIIVIYLYGMYIKGVRFLSKSQPFSLENCIIPIVFWMFINLLLTKFDENEGSSLAFSMVWTGITINGNKNSIMWLEFPYVSNEALEICTLNLMIFVTISICLWKQVRIELLRRKWTFTISFIGKKGFITRN